MVAEKRGESSNGWREETRIRILLWLEKSEDNSLMAVEMRR
jgi:hypothetical protein